MFEADHYLRKGEAAKKLGVAPRTLDHWVKTKPDFPQPRKMGKTRQSPVYFSNAALDEYMAIPNNKGAN